MRARVMTSALRGCSAIESKMTPGWRPRQPQNLRKLQPNQLLRPMQLLNVSVDKPLSPLPLSAPASKSLKQRTPPPTGGRKGLNEYG